MKGKDFKKIRNRLGVSGRKNNFVLPPLPKYKNYYYKVDHKSDYVYLVVNVIHTQKGCKEFIYNVNYKVFVPQIQSMKELWTLTHNFKHNFMSRMVSKRSGKTTLTHGEMKEFKVADDVELATVFLTYKELGS